MQTTLRLLSAALLVAWLALPTTGSEGGGNASGSGIWILPKPSGVGDLPTSGAATVRLQFLAAVGQDLHLQVAPELGAPVAILVDEVLGEACPLTVIGQVVRVPGPLVQAIANSQPAVAHVLISDASHLGYLIRLSVDAAASQVRVQVLE